MWHRCLVTGSSCLLSKLLLVWMWGKDTKARTAGGFQCLWQYISLGISNPGVGGFFTGVDGKCPLCPWYPGEAQWWKTPGSLCSESCCSWKAARPAITASFSQRVHQNRMDFYVENYWSQHEKFRILIRNEHSKLSKKKQCLPSLFSTFLSLMLWHLSSLQWESKESEMTFHSRLSCLFDVVVTGRTPNTNLLSPWVGDSKGFCCD